MVTGRAAARGTRGAGGGADPTAGLGGRDRRLGDETERARKTAGARIRDALRRVDSVGPEPAAYLRSTVSVGTVCRYAPASAG